MRRALQVAVVVLLAAAAAAVVLMAPARSPERIVAALLLVLVLPGVPAARLLRPGRATFDRPGAWPTVRLERLLLTFAVSIAVVILDSAGLYVFGVRLELDSWTLSLAAITVALAGIGLLPFARSAPMRTPRVRRRLGLRAVRPRGGVALAVVPAVLLVTAMLAGAGALTYASVRSSARADHFTQLWLLPSDRGQRSATIGILNHQGSARTYRLRVFVNRRPIRSQSVTVAGGATWRATQTYSASTATLRVELLGAGRAPQVTTLHVYPPPRRPPPRRSRPRRPPPRRSRT
jgi:uncharacterized membrane protein